MKRTNKAQFDGDDRSRRREGRLLKYYDARGNRRATRQAIKNSDYDNIPDQKKVRVEDSWNWD